MNTLWKPVVYRGRPFPYAVSDQGIVVSFSRRNFGKPMKPHVDRLGYHRLTLSLDGKSVYANIHRIVAESFLDYASDLDVNHIDFDRGNNALSNLELVTTQENVIHSARALRMPHGVGHRSARLNEDLVMEIRDAWKNGASERGLARKYGISTPSIRKVVYRQSWKHVP